MKSGNLILAAALILLGIKTHPRFARGQRFLTGGALIGLGATAALTGTSRK